MSTTDKTVSVSNSHNEQYDNKYWEFYGRGDNRYAIYPDFWRGSWGKPPLLGIVHADNEFLAERIAYDRGILNPHNCTFHPRFKNLGPNTKRPA